MSAQEDDFSFSCDGFEEGGPSTESICEKEVIEIANALVLSGSITVDQAMLMISNSRSHDPR